MRIRWNKFQIIGLVLGGVAALIIAYGYTTGDQLTVHTSSGNVPIGGAVAIVAAIVYVVGRAIDVWERHREQFRRPPRP